MTEKVPHGNDFVILLGTCAIIMLCTQGTDNLVFQRYESLFIHWETINLASGNFTHSYMLKSGGGRHSRLYIREHLSEKFTDPKNIKNIPKTQKISSRFLKFYFLFTKNHQMLFYSFTEKYNFGFPKISDARDQLYKIYEQKISD